jgi:hypothetical protein
MILLLTLREEGIMRKLLTQNGSEIAALATSFDQERSHG